MPQKINKQINKIKIIIEQDFSQKPTVKCIHMHSSKKY